MSIDLPVAGETPWDAKLNAAITGIDADLQATKGTYWGMWTGTQAAYDAIVTKNPNTLYVVV